MSPKQFVTLAAALAAAVIFCAPRAMGGTGDLDPSFADLGRLMEIPGMEARSVDLIDSGGIFVGSYGLSVTSNIDGCSVDGISFTSHFVGDGVSDPSIGSARVDGIQALALRRQADGRVVGVGRRVSGNSFFGGRCFLNPRSLAAFRLNLDGSLDTSFSGDGIFDWKTGASSPRHQGDSLLLEGNGKVVIAGTMTDGATGKSHLVVLRLRSNGIRDRLFGNEGFYVGPEVGYQSTDIARAPAGGYRIAGNGPYGCFVVGLTTDGQLDEAFGTAGVALVVGPQFERVTCNALTATADGVLLIAGIAGERGFVARLLAGGEADRAFAADPAIAGSMTKVTAITTGSNNNVYLAGVGPKGTSILRLNSTGSLDASFGDSGRTWIDLPSPYPWIDLPSPGLWNRFPSPNPGQWAVNDMAVHADGGLIVAGAGPFVARMLGDEGGESAGVVSVFPHDASAREADGRSIVRVRRSGGGDGSVSVDYRTVADGNAVVDEDFTAKQGTLHWADGDRSNRAIVVEIAQNAGKAEIPEEFHVVLDNIQGGAGLGRTAAKVTIAPDGEPGGQLQFYPRVDSTIHPTIFEADDFVQVHVSREFYEVGRVCVTASTRSGTAVAGQDFTATTSLLCWEDRQSGDRIVQVPILRDNLSEQEEQFTVVLSNATGGSVIGARRVARVTIRANH